MLIHKLRLQHGWSQEQLAELAGVSVRTVQRLEQGKPATTESLKALGSALGVPFHELRTTPMETSTDMTHATADAPSPIASDEALALYKVRKLRGFYIHALYYAVVMTGLLLLNLWTARDGGPFWVIWPALGWGVGLLINGIKVNGLLPFLGADWERREVEKLLGRKL